MAASVTHLRPSFFTFAKILGAVLVMFAAAGAQAAIDRSHPFRLFDANSPSNPYDLPDLDEIPAGPYLYTRWGNYLGTPSLFAPPYGRLTLTTLTTGPYSYKNKDLFISSSLSSLNRIALPDVAPASTNAIWTAPTAEQDGGIVYLVQPEGVLNHWFRKRHFSTSLNLFSELAEQKSVGPDNRKLIVLIHGWNPGSNAYSYSGEFQELVSAVYDQIADYPDWQLVLYRWEADADTGPVFTTDVAINGTEAAEAAHQHGKHLGELLRTLSPQVEKVHLIAHSAGAWAARSAAKYLFDSAATQPTIQVTLLDPFIPDQVPGIAPGQQGNLTKARMDSMSLFAANRKIYRLENYFSDDVALGTNVVNFSWHSDRDSNLRVDWKKAMSSLVYYGDTDPALTIGSGHFGPILFYADTVSAYKSGAVPAPALANPVIDIQRHGWGSSLFLNELIIDQPPQSQTSAILGQPVSFTVHALTRREDLNLGSLSLPISYSWQKLNESTGVWGSAFGSNSTSTFTLNAPTADEAGRYRVVLNNGSGDTYAEFALSFSATAGSPHVSIIAPQSAASVTGTVGVSTQVSASVDRVEFYLDGQLKSSDAVAPFAWSWDTTATANGAHTLTAKAYGGLVESLLGFSAPVVLTVNNNTVSPPVTDDYGDLSTQAAVLASGSSVQGLISSPTDVDWFKIVVTTPGSLTLNLSVPDTKDYDLELFGPDAAYIKGSYSDLGLSESISYNATTTGAYYVRVYGYPVSNGSFSASAAYSVSVNKLRSATSSVLITQYYEGTLNIQKYIELTNIGDVPVDLEGWWLTGWHNEKRNQWRAGTDRPTVQTDLAGIVLQAKQSVVIGGAGSVIPSHVGDFVEGDIRHNGDDSVVLYSHYDGIAFRPEHIADVIAVTAFQANDISIVRVSPFVEFDYSTSGSFMDYLGEVWKIVSLEAVNDANFGDDAFLGSSALGTAQEAPPRPVIEQHPLSMTVPTGGQAKFDVTLLSSSEVTYIWQRAYYGTSKWWAALVDDVHHSGCRTAKLTVSATQALSGSEYRVMVTNRRGRVFSDAAILSVDSSQPPPVIAAPETLPSGVLGVPYNFAFLVSGGVSPYIWTHVSGNLPSGISLSASGVISGTPTLATIATFGVRVADTIGQSETRSFSLSIVTPYEDWGKASFTSEEIAGGLAAASEDFDRDGCENLLEYAFGGDPKVPDAILTAPVVAFQDGRLVISFWCDAARADLTYTVQVSASLATGSWVDIAQSVGGGPVTAIEARAIVEDSGVGRRTVLVKDHSSPSVQTQNFMRIRVTKL